MPKQKTPAQIVAFHQRQIKLANSLPLDVYLRILKEDELTITIRGKLYSCKLTEKSTECRWCLQSPYNESHTFRGYFCTRDRIAQVYAWAGVHDDNLFSSRWRSSVVKAYADSLGVDEFAAAEYILKKAASYCSSGNAGGSDGTTG